MIFMKQCCLGFLLLGCFFLSPALSEDLIWDLQAVDSQGLGTHPKVGADPGVDPLTSPNRVRVVGIALNRPDEILDTSTQWQVYVQAQWPEQGGIAVWAGKFYNPTWPRYPTDIEPGDLLQVEGFVMNARGKVNINERHSAAPELQFIVTKIASNVGMPTPEIITDLSLCNSFDSTRQSGGERFQAQWVKFINVHLISGTWAAGQTVIVADRHDNRMNLLLSSQGVFDTAPLGEFSVTGIFDQEDLDVPYTSGYRLWVKNSGFIEQSTSSVENWESY